MNATARGLGLAVMVVGALTSAAARAADAQPSAACDRACLQSVADKYLRALQTRSIACGARLCIER
ncbi:MAG TPA: hypothetical protein VNU73_05035, partial [Steroidobacteraceae bacterium]|nr:hypothetical protein [Steroidobacteraceae bacterium]